MLSAPKSWMRTDRGDMASTLSSQYKKKPEEKWSEAERSEIDRFEIESFYCRDVTPALLKEDANWKLRRAIRYFQLLMAPDDVLKDQDREFTKDYSGQHLEAV